MGPKLRQRGGRALERRPPDERRDLTNWFFAAASPIPSSGRCMTPAPRPNAKSCMTNRQLRRGSSRFNRSSDQTGSKRASSTTWCGTQIFADAARDVGMTVSDDEIRRYLYELGRGRVTPRRNASDDSPHPIGLEGDFGRIRVQRAARRIAGPLLLGTVTRLPRPPSCPSNSGQIGCG